MMTTEDVCVKIPCKKTQNNTIALGQPFLAGFSIPQIRSHVIKLRRDQAPAFLDGVKCFKARQVNQ